METWKALGGRVPISNKDEAEATVFRMQIMVHPSLDLVPNLICGTGRLRKYDRHL